MNDMSKLIKHVREAPNFFILLVSFLCIALCLLVSGLVIFTMYINSPIYTVYRRFL